MDRAQLTRLLLVTSILYVISFYFIGSAIKPGYSQLSNFVSEYNATGTPWAGTLTYVGYLATSVLFSAFLVSAAPLAQVSGISRLGFWLLWSVPASYFLAVIAPCDAGCPIEGSTSQLMHNFLGIVTYFGMGASIALVALASKFSAFKLRRTFMLLAGIAFPVVFIVMVQPEVAPWRGLLQRSLDVALAISLILIAWTLIPSGQQARQAVA
jgi:hypothetical protein